MKRKRIMTWLISILSIVALLAIAGVIFINLPQFGRAPSGHRLERIRKSPNYRDGQFHNREVTPQMTSDKGFFASWWDFLFEKDPDLTPSEPLEMEKVDLTKLPSPSITWFGHSSYLLNIGAKRILVDPVFGSASPVGFLFKPFKGTTRYQAEDMPPIDYLVITHDHYDHLEYETVKALKDCVGKVICPLGVGEHFEHWGYPADKIIELDWDESAILGDGFKVNCHTARHFSGRSLRRNNTLWASYLLELPEGNIFIGGDSGYGRHFKQIGEKYKGEIDLAILENGQYNKDWRYIHTMPAQLDSAVRDLGARHNITVHHSKYALSRHPWDEPLKNERQLPPADSVMILDLGRPNQILKQ